MNFGLARTAQIAGWQTAAPAGNTRRTGTAATLTSYTFTGYNGANYTTSIAEFGAGSLDVSTSNDTIGYANYPGAWPSGTGDFCFEGWVYIPAARDNTTGVPIALDQPTAPGGAAVRFGTGYNSGNINALQIFARGHADLDSAAYTWPRDQWVHWAVQRKSAAMSFWANGNKLTITGGSGGGTRNFVAPTGTQSVVLGSYEPNTSDETLEAYLDEVCVSNSWRYDDTQSTYVVPTAAFTVDVYTDMLMHFDSNLSTAAS